MSTTFHGLHKWHEHLFEHLGWMILAKEHGMADKINVYRNSLDKFCAEVDAYLIKNAKIEEDKRNDLLQLKENVIVLKKAFVKL